MSPLALVVAYLGIAIILVRGPLLFAPEATVDRFQRWFFPSDARFRLVGVGMLFTLAAPLVLAARLTPPAHPDVVLLETLGWVVAAGGASVILFPKPLRGFIEGILTGAPPSVLQVLGAVNLAFGLFLVWLAFTVL